MKSLLLMLLVFVLSAGFAQENPVGIFQDHADVGSPKKPGTAQYDESTQTYTLKGAGYNIWFNRDEFQFAYKKLKGNFILTADFEFVGTGVDGHRKIGWMVRESKDDNASHVSAVAHGDGLTLLQWRRLKGAFMRDPEDEAFSTKKNYRTIQLERWGKELIMRAAHPGEPFHRIGSVTMEDMPEEVLAGLFIGSHNPEVVEEARVWNVRIDQPVGEDYNPNKEGYIGCRLEIMNVFDGKRKVIHEESGRFEAPNWMPDGKKLIINKDGSLYKIPVAGGELEKINTGTINKNNNDHGISFDGKTLAMSAQRDGMPGGGSTVYTVPIDGGTPKQITEKTPSYWHGWAPNNKDVVFVGQRDGKNYDIYRISVNGGEEIKLTNNKGTHADGPEYAPDGKHIYYNGSQSGTMQIWRMKPDGSAPEQLTFDDYNNWFPHISPDGKWIAFISFPPDIPVDSHPSYKRVTLKLMPVSGGAPKVIAYLYGGQGTINVPSWSPDSKSIAFVSNSGK